jgi:hypothetical protein
VHRCLRFDHGAILASLRARIARGLCQVCAARLIREHYPRIRDHAEMCELFGTSGAAMGRRLHSVIEPGP